MLVHSEGAGSARAGVGGQIRGRRPHGYLDGSTAETTVSNSRRAPRPQRTRIPRKQNQGLRPGGARAARMEDCVGEDELSARRDIRLKPAVAKVPDCMESDSGSS